MRATYLEAKLAMLGPNDLKENNLPGYGAVGLAYSLITQVVLGTTKNGLQGTGT